MSRLIGLDHGERRIGVAVADTETGMAFERPAIRTRSQAAAVAEVGRLLASEGADVIVIDLPLHADGSEGAQARRARAFGDALAQIGATVCYSDERFTSWAAAEQLGAEGRRAHRSGGEVDSAAARLILQQYLDALPEAPSHPTDPTQETA